MLSLRLILETTLLVNHILKAPESYFEGRQLEKQACFCQKTGMEKAHGRAEDKTHDKPTGPYLTAWNGHKGT